MGRRGELRTERLLLRPFNIGNVEDILECINGSNSAEYQINIPLTNHTKEEVENLVSIFSDLV